MLAVFFVIGRTMVRLVDILVPKGAPDTALGLPRLLLQTQQLVPVEGFFVLLGAVDGGKSFVDQSLVDAQITSAAFDKDVTQQPLVVIFTVNDEPNIFLVASGFGVILGVLGKGLLLLELGRVDSQQPNPPFINQSQRISVVDISDPELLGSLGQAAVLGGQAAGVALFWRIDFVGRLLLLLVGRL